MFRAGEASSVLGATIVLLAGQLATAALQAAEPAPPIVWLKEMCLDTVLVRDGQPNAAVVVPASGRHETAARAIVEAVKKMTGATLPVLRDTDVKLPLTRNLVILGNRSTNTLIEQLYNLSYTYLDLKYPGAGGYAVHSLHNPFANGHNAILVGSSDDRGMVEAVDAFLATAAGSARRGTLSLGWILRVKLGDGLRVPPSANSPACLAWESDGAPADYFGWNSVSRNMALYYMTGDGKFLREFLRLAFPDKKTIQELWEVDGERIENKEHPLAGSYHYCAHPMILLWDLIEESPLLTDQQRLRITQEFAGGQSHFHVPGGRFVGDRHATYQALMVYCRARYFSKYYPHPAWEAAMAGAASHFASLAHTIHIGSHQDTPNSGHAYVNTGYEPLMSYMLISGDRRGLESGMLGTILRGYDGLISGRRNESTLAHQSLSFANKAAYLTGDARFIYYRNLASKDTSGFRIGQSYWPERPERAPEELANRIVVRPLSDVGCEGRSVPPDEAFHWLTYRSGPRGTDDYFKIGGMFDQTRRPYYCLNLEKLRIGEATLLENNDHNSTVIARRQGLIAAELPLESALKVHKVVGDVAHVEAEVPKFGYGVWRRAVLHAKGRWTVVADQLTARQDTQQLEMRVQWALPTAARLTEEGRFEYAAGKATAVLIPATRAGLRAGGGLAQCTVRGDVKAGERLEMISLLDRHPSDVRPRLSCARLTDSAAMLSVPGPVLAALGRVELANQQVEVDAEAVLVGSEFVYAAGVRTLTCGEPLLAASKPVDVYWSLREGKVTLFCPVPTAFAIAATRGTDLSERQYPLPVTRIADGLIWTRMDRGDHTVTGAVLPAETTGRLQKKLEALRQASSRQTPPQQDEQLPSRLAVLQPVTTQRVQGAVTRVLPGPERNGIASVYAISEANRAYSLGIDGTLQGATESPAKIMSAAYWPEAGLLLLGGADDRVYAFDDGGRLRWTFQSEMHPDLYATGKTYWFKKDLPGISGLTTGCLTGQGTQAFVGSACTVEVVDPSGKLLKRVPIYWGSCAVMQIVPNPDKTRKLVVAKSPNLSNEYSTIHGGTWSVGHFGVSPPFQLSQSTLNILVDDLNHDGQLEVICDTNGSMNNVRVYDCLGKSLWSAEFGPPSAVATRIGIAVPPPIMRGLVVVDFQGKGYKHVVAATDERLVTAFRADGKQAWASYLPSAPQSLCRLPRDGGDLLAVGCENGMLLLIDATGKAVAKAHLAGAVRSLYAVKHGARLVLVVGTDAGDIAVFHPPH
jgi:hypothetical protein